jgi:hypothetical protein
MSSDTESSNTSTSEVDSEINLASSDEVVRIINTQFLPYQDEPLAADAASAKYVNLYSEDGQSEENPHPDGLSPNVLASRCKGEIPLSDW